MTDGETTSGTTRTPRERAIARVRDLLDEPLREPSEAGFMLAVPLGDIVDAVVREYGDDAMRLPRYYPDDEGQPLMLGQARRVDPETGVPPNVYAAVSTGLPNGRVHVRVTEDGPADPPVSVEFTAASDTLPHPLRFLLAACEHAQANTRTSVGGAE